MFLHFHEKYNMILFVLKILDRIQIKTLNFFFFLFIYFLSFLILTLKENIHKKITNTQTSPFSMFTHTLTLPYSLQNIHNSK
jgi:hypothetical protein